MSILERYDDALLSSNSGFKNLKQLHVNDGTEALFQMAVMFGEGIVAKGGALVVDTGKHTGRSASDKFIVRDATTENTVWWDANKSITTAQFDLLHQDFIDHAQGMTLFSQDLFGGADQANTLPTRIFTEFAWHALFIRHLLREGTPEQMANFTAEMTIINLPSFKADPARHGCRSETIIACDFSRKIVLIAGTEYAGEIKKSVFSMLNYMLPAKNIMPMHCSANIGAEGSAIFFGLSGTGKTTLSANPERILIGDDEHGWSENGLFNFEGGCYAKVIKLSETAEPEIYATTQQFATVLENVAVNSQTRELDLDDSSLTENTRAAYPLTAIPNAAKSGTGEQPKNIIMLTADAFGILPPLAKLTPEQAIYHFLSGYTAKVAGTEEGVTEPQATFSTCFGAPFMSRHPIEYGNLLQKLIKQHDVNIWLVNTGWTGGKYGIGSRMPIKATRALLEAALSGSLDKVAMRIDENFGLQVPISVANVDTKLLNPRDTWADESAYDQQAEALAIMFRNNFVKYQDRVSVAVMDAAPKG
ncbi:MAG: phosphoenolpyruvate carboxykinase [Rhizobiales bacterium]|nr:phosphoenolpyruvate carboxykinase [Hyphomicrobiales bacterium]NRB14449.1 phosphoenolpyruvate carboxykinase [Hyphomicrobiales bacterium]